MEADFKKARQQKASLKDPLKEDRLPPHSTEGEQGILGCVLLSPEDCIGTCMEKLPSSEVFFELRHRAIYEAILAMHEDGVAIDLITLHQELKDLTQLEGVGGLAYLSELPDKVPSAANLDYYIAIVREKYTLRKTIGLATEVVSRAYDHQGEVDQLVGELASDIIELSNSIQVTETLYSAKTLVPKSIEWAEKAFENKGKGSGIETGMIDFDRLTGGLQVGEFTIVAARPSVGKSSLAMNIAEHVSVDLGIPVCVFSLEMSALSLMNRTICSRARINMNRVRDGEMLESDYGKMTSAASAIKKAPLFIDDASGSSIMKIQAKARRLHKQNGIRLFVVDYLQMMTSPRKRENRQQEIADISTGLKFIAKDLNVHVLVASQLNREIEKDKNKRKPRMSDIRESGSIEQDADLITFLYRASMEDDGDATQDSMSIAVNWLIEKNRNGRVGEIRLTFLKPFTRFESAANTNEP